MEENRKLWLLIPLVVILTAGIAGGGTWYYLKNKNDKEVKNLTAQLSSLQSSSASSASSSSADADETVDWKTFENTLYGYSFKYPTNLTISTAAGEGSSYTDAKDKTTQVTLTSNNVLFSMSLAGGIKTITKDSLKYQFALAFNLEPIKVGSENGYQTVFTTVDNTIVSNFYFIQKGDSVFMITMTKDNNTISKILSTFKFDETLTWKAYTNTVDKYSIKYPADWKVDSNNQEYVNLNSVAQAKVIDDFAKKAKEGFAGGGPSPDIAIARYSSLKNVNTNENYSSLLDYATKIGSPDAKPVEISAGSVKGYKTVDDQSYSADAYIFEVDGKIYKVLAFGTGKVTKELLSKIISTFQFTK
jgi:hypothetical protein